MGKFKEGDIIVGNEGAEVYGYTKQSQGYVGRVISCGERTMKAETIDTRSWKHLIGNIELLDPTRFDLQDSELALIAQMARGDA